MKYTNDSVIEFNGENKDFTMLIESMNNDQIQKLI
jgi:hypothetical protein